MNYQRERQDTYYLSKVYDPVILYSDGRVGEVAKKDVKVRVELPSRIEGQKRIGEIKQSQLGEIAIHASLADYLVSRQRNVADKMPYRNSWRLKDMPAETLAAYEEWRHSAQALDLDVIRELAASKVTSNENRLTDAIPCPNCVHSDHQYACYTCGHAREIYRYPLARYHDAEKIYDVPVDVADMIRLNPAMLAYETEWEIDDNGLMSAKQRIAFNAQIIPKEYVTGEKSGEMLTIDPVDGLSRKITLATAGWAEDKKLRKNSRMFQPNETPAAYTPESYLDTLQNSVALHIYREPKGGKDYNAMIKTLHAEVGRRGLELAFEYKYMGMGDSEARFMFAKRIEDYVITQPFAGSLTAEAATEYAVEQLAKK